MKTTIRPLLRPRLIIVAPIRFVEPFPLTSQSTRFVSIQPSRRRNVRRTPESSKNAQHNAEIPPSNPIPSPTPHSSQAPHESSPVSTTQASLSTTLATIDPDTNTLLAPVSVPLDPNSILSPKHPAHNLLSHSSLIIQRKLEMMNIFLGFEQANRYTILSPTGETIGYMAEHDGGFGKVLGRQWFRTHRSFMANVFDLTGREVLRFHRPFSWINSKIKVYDPLEMNALPHATVSSSTEVATTAAKELGEQQISQVPMSAMRVIGEAQSEWAPLRRKYNLFLSHDPTADPNASPSIPEPNSQTHPPAPHHRKHSPNSPTSTRPSYPGPSPSSTATTTSLAP